MSVRQCVFMSTCLVACIAICLSFCLPGCLSACLSVYLSVGMYFSMYLCVDVCMCTRVYRRGSKAHAHHAYIRTGMFSFMHTCLFRSFLACLHACGSFSLVRPPPPAQCKFIDWHARFWVLGSDQVRTTSTNCHRNKNARTTVVQMTTSC